MTEQTLPVPSFPVNIVEYSPEEFAESLWKFYQKLLELGFEKEFAEKLTMIFCKRP